MNNQITPDFGAVLRKVQSSGPPKIMLSVEHRGSKAHVRINSSSLGILQTCARKAQYTLHEKWRALSGSPPLVYGSAIHKALEVFYSHPARERSIPDNFDEVANNMAEGHLSPEPHFLYDAIKAFIEVAEPLRMLTFNDKRSIQSGVWVLSNYFKTYLHDTYVIHTDENGPLVERTFSVPFYDDSALSIELFGTIDFVLRNEVTGEILCGDHKTSSQMGNDFLNRIKPNHQYTGYLYGAHKALGITSENFMVNGIQVKAKPMTSRGGPPTFTRQITRRTEQDFEEFKQSVLWAVRSYLSWEYTGTWPIGNVDACSQWGGCSYLDVCSSPNELRQNMMEAKFQREQP